MSPPEADPAAAGRGARPGRATPRSVLLPTPPPGRPQARARAAAAQLCRHLLRRTSSAHDPVRERRSCLDTPTAPAQTPASWRYLAPRGKGVLFSSPSQPTPSFRNASDTRELSDEGQQSKCGNRGYPTRNQHRPMGDSVIRVLSGWDRAQIGVANTSALMAPVRRHCPHPTRKSEAGSDTARRIVQQPLPVDRS